MYKIDLLSCIWCPNPTFALNSDVRTRPALSNLMSEPSLLSCIWFVFTKHALCYYLNTKQLLYYLLTKSTFHSRYSVQTQFIIQVFTVGPNIQIKPSPSCRVGHRVLSVQNVPFFFLIFWRLLEPKRTFRSFPFFSKERKRAQRTQHFFAKDVKECENISFFCKRTQNIPFFFQNIYRNILYIDIYRFFKMNL